MNSCPTTTLLMPERCLSKTYFSPIRHITVLFCHGTLKHHLKTILGDHFKEWNYHWKEQHNFFKCCYWIYHNNDTHLHYEIRKKKARHYFVQAGNVHLVFVQSLSCGWFFATPWTTARQASLSFTMSQSLLKFMSSESVMLSNHLTTSASAYFSYSNLINGYRFLSHMFYLSL